MLGQRFHIRNTAFRMLPNPTPYSWDKNLFDLPQLVKEHWSRIWDSDISRTRIPQIETLEDITRSVIKALHIDKLSSALGYSANLLERLDDAIDKFDTYLELETCDPDLVSLVIREHLQEVLKMLNDPDDAADRDVKQIHGYLFLYSPRWSHESNRYRRKSTHYAPYTSARPGAVQQNPPGSTISKSSLSTIPVLVVPSLRDPREAIGGEAIGGEAIGDEATAIWCTLVLRVLCWLTLHDFHRRDAQISKNEVYSS